MGSPTKFLGAFEHSLDDKSRLAVPARFREALKDGLFISRGLDRCLVLWDSDSFLALASDYNNLNEFNGGARRLKRHFFSGAVEAQPDKLGRILIPQYLREYAQLGTDVVVVGVGDRVEVWARDEWQRELVAAERDSAELAERLVG